MGKRFVEVEASFNTNGAITPLELIWEDGRSFKIDKVIEIKRAASFLAGGQGLRYKCKIAGKERYIFLENNRWFVETKQ